ncbi:hypothetical protein PIB30_052816 [Stylosanthes scabra]|uniref:Uncharacterized protein n=1 Tax=Stylosanthes scabra TaxID=79078 RepID=A0ABU6YIS2_9FABA|nr:hypothetical protein [Stylosanthes scabra]
MLEDATKKARRKNMDSWKVHVIVNGVEIPEDITSNQVFSLPAGRQVVLPFDALLRKIVEMDGLLSTLLGSMDYDFSLFLIGVRSWKQMTVYKECEYNRKIKVGKFLEGYMGNLFHKFYDDSKSLAENVEHRCPEGIDKDD